MEAVKFRRTEVKVGDCMSAGADPEILKRRGPLWVLGLKILGFRWSKKAEITLETISFW